MAVYALKVDFLESLCDQLTVFPRLLPGLRCHVARHQANLLMVPKLVGVVNQYLLEGLSQHVDGVVSQGAVGRDLPDAGRLIAGIFLSRLRHSLRNLCTTSDFSDTRRSPVMLTAPNSAIPSSQLSSRTSPDIRRLQPAHTQARTRAPTQPFNH